MTLRSGTPPFKNAEIKRVLQGNNIVLYIIFANAYDASLWHFLFKSPLISINGERRAYKIAEAEAPKHILQELL